MIKKILNFIGKFAMVCVALSSIYLVNLFFMKPFSIDHFLTKEITMELTSSPEYMTYLGAFDKFNWITNHSSRLSVASEDDVQNEIVATEKIIKTLYAYNDNRLSDIQKTTKKIAIFDYENILNELRNFPYHSYPLNQIGGFHIQTIEFITDNHPVRNFNEANSYIDRVEMIDEVFEGYLIGLNKQSEAGIFPPLFVYENVINQINELTSYPISEHPLYTQLLRKAKDINLSPDELKSLELRLKKAINNEVNPAYGMLKDFMTRTMLNANENYGVWSLPNGDEFYNLRIKSFTTTDFTAEEIHQIGLSEVKRISEKMKEILVGLGYEDSKTVGQLMNDLNENPDFLYADTPDRKDIVVNDYTEMVEEAYDVMIDYFHTMPKAGVIVKAVPEYSEKNAAGGYYQSPALDGSRPGVFYANLYDIKQTPTYSMRTLAYHEATPGHHHQIAHSLENDDLTIYRRFGYYTSAFAEGWALYSEQLALEAGLAKDPYDELGILQSELFRAVRLVVDTGMHYKRWNREKAMNYMKSKTGMSDTEVRVEIERYIVWPGQALSYKVGMIKILELREKAMKELGNEFNIKDFHSAVLDHGNPPLFIVEEMIDKMILSSKNN
tara:strand:+ start:3551 stop:5380 length:1830 start_codon:yes stop_codon:yes gene_type:complete